MLMVVVSDPQKRIDDIADAAGQPDGEKQEKEDVRKQRNPVGHSESRKAE